MSTVHPLSASELKLCRSLLQKKYRTRHGLFLAEGERTVQQLLDRDSLTIDYVILQDETRVPEFEERAAISGAKVRISTAKTLKMLTDTQTTQGILAVVRIPEQPALDAITIKPGSMIIALDGLGDPGNLGTVYRTAAWFGADFLIAGKGTVDLYNPKTVRSTAGATGTVPVIEAELLAALEQLQQKGCAVRLLDLSPEAESVAGLADTLGEQPAVFVLGNEAHGIQDALRERYQSVYIPGNSDNVESLNAAVSAGILMSRMRLSP